MGDRYGRISGGKVILSLLLGASLSTLAAEKPNILVVTIDDMNCDSVGAFGCKVKGTTPNLDAFAADGIRFKHAHVHASSCIPSRNTVMTGRYMFNSGVEGFYAVPKEQVTYKTTPELLRDRGYFTMIRGKSSHSMPYYPYPAWDINFDLELKEKSENSRKVETFYSYTKKGIEAAKKAGKPFYYAIDIHDPHTALYSFAFKKGELSTKLNKQDIDNPPSRIYTPDEITMPSYLPDTPLSRKEMAAYYSSVRRADDSFGKIIQALKDTGSYDNTVVLFFSDHGMPFPFAKTAMYYHSTHTPLMARWPGVSQSGAVDDEHVIGTIDIQPTLMEIIGEEKPKGIDGNSFASILQGKKQEGREFVYTTYEENVGGNRQPARAVISKSHTYICNIWSDGVRKFATATKGMATTSEMFRLAKAGDKQMVARAELFEHSTPEQFFDVQKDPDGMNNLMESKEHAALIEKHKAAMIRYMETYRDPMLEVYQKRNDKAFVEAYLSKLDKASQMRRQDASFSRSGKAKAAKKKRQKGNKGQKK